MMSVCIFVGSHPFQLYTLALKGWRSLLLSQFQASLQLWGVAYLWNVCCPIDYCRGVKFSMSFCWKLVAADFYFYFPFKCLFQQRWCAECMV